jgi:hypothetical protein
MNTSGPDGFGLPDIETLTRLANQFFGEWPGKDAVTGAPMPQDFRAPGEAELKALLDSLSPAVPTWT